MTEQDQQTQSAVCWHCHEEPRLPDQILCETCFGNAVEEMAGSGVLAKAMHSWIQAQSPAPQQTEG
jgi:hypothetical protein